MITLGIGHDLFISSAALAIDGRIVAAMAEERLNRQKQYKGYPALAVNECLKMAGIKFRDVDIVSVGWNPLRHMAFANRRLSETSRARQEYLYAVPNMLIGCHGLSVADTIQQHWPEGEPRVAYYDHQMAHAANAFYLSQFDEAAIFCADGMGEIETSISGLATRANGIKKLNATRMPHSLGLFYGTVTQFLGYRPDSDEWKVMAMASYGNRENRFYDRVRRLIELDKDNGSFYVDQKYFSYSNPEVQYGRFYTEAFLAEFGTPREKDGPIEDWHCDLANAFQRVFEEVVSELLTALANQTGSKNLGVAGGCAMNSVYNGRIAELTPFENIYISSCPDDSGIAVGSALLAYHSEASNPSYPDHPHNYWGPSFDDEIEETLTKYKQVGRKLSDPSKTAAELIASGKLIGWFQGAMEFGQRALGNRSILADPRSEATKDQVNAAVKYREGFRPFAPAILAERVRDYFEFEGTDSVPFMERVYQFKESVKSGLGAVVHVDGTGRLQSVVREQNPRFYDLIQHFDKLTGTPIVLNTSFNLNGEPIVCNPTDAIRTFHSCGLDALIMGDYLIEKSPSEPAS